MALIICPECSTEISDKAKKCPHCGFPFEVEKEISDSSKAAKSFSINRKKISLISFIAIAIISCLVVYGFYVKENEKNSYLKNAQYFYDALLSNASECEDMTNEVRTIWSNAIDSRYGDFNTEINNYYGKSTTIDKIESLTAMDLIIDNYMKKLANPPQERIQLYDELKNAYETYKKLYSQATSPSGSLISYSQNVNSLISDLVSKLQTIKQILP